MQGFFHFAEAKIFKISGPDSIRYLNARLTNKIPALGIGAGFWAAGLTPQGRPEFFGFLHRSGEQEFFFVLDGGERESILSALLRYRVADRVDCLDLSDSLSLVHLVSSRSKDIPSFLLQTGLQTGKFADVVQYSNLRSQYAGCDILCSKEASPALLVQCEQAGLGAISSEHMHAGRILGNRPGFPDEWSEKHSFLEYHFLDAASFDKGCYTGQEVVEKMHSLGKPPKLLRRVRSLDLKLCGKTGIPLTVREKPAGEALAFVKHPDDDTCCISFAFLRNQDEIHNGQIYSEGSQVEIF